MTVKRAVDALTGNFVRTILAGAALSLLIWMVGIPTAIGVISNNVANLNGKIDDLKNNMQTHDALVDQEIADIVREQSDMKQAEARLEQRMDDTQEARPLDLIHRRAQAPDPPIIGPVIRAITGAFRHASRGARHSGAGR